MDLPASLITQLDSLTTALDDPGTDLRAILAVLSDDVTSAVPSYLGLTITMVTDGDAVQLTAVAVSKAAVNASLRLPLPLLAGSEAGSTIEFYAGVPGAFARMAHDVRQTYGLDGEVVLDDHRTGPTNQTGTAVAMGVDDFTMVNRAVGVLIGKGRTPDEANNELHASAQRASISLPDAAQAVLRDLHPE